MSASCRLLAYISIAQQAAYKLSPVVRFDTTFADSVRGPVDYQSWLSPRPLSELTSWDASESVPQVDVSTSESLPDPNLRPSLTTNTKPSKPKTIDIAK